MSFQVTTLFCGFLSGWIYNLNNSILAGFNSCSGTALTPGAQTLHRLFSTTIRCSVLGMHLFGGKFYMHVVENRPCSCSEIRNGTLACDPARKNFDSLLWSLVTVFQVKTVREHVARRSSAALEPPSNRPQTTPKSPSTAIQLPTALESS